MRLAIVALVLIAAFAPGVGAGPVAPRQVLFLGQDFRNGGIAAAYRAFEEAAHEMPWQLHAANGQGDRTRIRQLFAEALRRHIDGVVLGGFNDQEVADLLPREGGPVLVGWHAAAQPGATALMFANVTTDPGRVAELAADQVCRHATAAAGVVIFNDSRFAIANVKTQRMRERLQHHPQCRLLAVEDVPISEVGPRMPAALESLQQRFGARWTHVLAINDIYMDSINFPVEQIGRADLVAVAAGDGSHAALSRIRAGRSRQVATVAEPIGQQGWQLADELRRAFAGQPPSGRVTQPVVVTAELLKGRPRYEVGDEQPYREDYRRRWQDATARP